MKLIISDSKLADIGIEEKENILIEKEDFIQNCIGCFGCWVKTPTKCILKDGFEDIPKKLAQCDELIIISECVYGGYSPFVKNVMDRSIGFIHPFFEKRKGEMHHKLRNQKQIKMKVYFYGDSITDIEKETAQSLIEANAINLNYESTQVYFVNDVQELKGIIK